MNASVRQSAERTVRSDVSSSPAVTHAMQAASLAVVK